MPKPSTAEDFLGLVRKSGLLDEKQLTEYLASPKSGTASAGDARSLADAMVRDGLLTPFQAKQLLEGKSHGFRINDKYKLLEHLGEGGMGSVFLCEHVTMRRRVAIKVLPIAKAKDPSYLERFYREARAVAALDHPNIVRAHDIDQNGKIHFLVMEYVDGTNLHEIVRKSGPLDVARAANYIQQAALGLQHAHEAGLVHRDIKPANLIVDRNGVVKLLDMGLARFFHGDDGLSQKFDETVLGTTDYLAPEQTLASNVDIRADIYSLGATFYFCLTGQTLFGEGQTAHKLIWHQTRQPRSIRSLRPDVPDDLAALIEKQMLAKDPEQRISLPIEVAEALAPWTTAPVPPPAADEMPRLCPALRGLAGEARPSPTPVSGARRAAGAPSGWTISGFPPASSSSPAVPSRRPAPASTGVASASAIVTPSPASDPPTKAAKKKESGRIQAEEPAEAKPLPSASARKRKVQPAAPHRNWILWAAMGAALALLLLLGGGLWWMFAGPASGARPPSVPPVIAPPVTNTPLPPVAVQPPAAGGEVSIALNNGAYRIHTPGYEAKVEADGCLTSLRAGGAEFLHVSGKVARGVYCYQARTLKLPNLAQPASNVLTAQGDMASIRYEFGPQALTLSVTNSTNAPMAYYAIFDSAVRAVSGDKGEWARTPTVKAWRDTTWFAGAARLHISGGSRVWGPFEEAYPVWEASLRPHETRQIVMTPGAATGPELAHVKEVSWQKRVEKAKYSAVVDSDGCMTSLTLGGQEVLHIGGPVSRGVYLHQKAGTLRLTTIEEPTPNAVAARNERGSLRYEFGPDSITITAANAGSEPLNFFLVFNPVVTAVANDKGERARTPTTKPWPTTTWFVGKYKLAISGGSRIWGPWGQASNLQVWECALPPGQKRTAVLKVTESDLALQSPLEYQVFQRYSRLRGQIALKGKIIPACDKVEVRVTGKPLEGGLPGKWTAVAFDEAERAFDTILPLPAGGWYKLELRALRRNQVVAEETVEHVGIGEVFVCAGQSNSTNCGGERLKTATKMVSSFSGTSWQLADDPQPGVLDRTSNGSPWPAFGDALSEKCKVPIGVCSTGFSGSSVRQWQPGGEFSKKMLAKIERLGVGGFRAVLWHQGETDVGMAAEMYAKLLTTSIEASRKQAGWDFPWMVARVSYHNPEHPSYPTTRAAQKKLWDTGAALEGPDTDALGGDNRDDGGKGIHFSGKGLRAHGKLWADKVSAYLDKVEGE